MLRIRKKQTKNDKNVLFIFGGRFRQISAAGASDGDSDSGSGSVGSAVVVVVVAGQW